MILSECAGVGPRLSWCNTMLVRYGVELRHLRYFVVVAEELHMGRAAQRLSISQPPLSRQIRELEEEIGFPLFVRGYHRMELTAAGRAYLSQARQILDQVHRATEEAANIARGHAGHVRLGHGTHLPEGYLSRVIAAFQQVAPCVTVDVLEGPSPKILEALRGKSIDAAFVMPPRRTQGLVVRALLSEPLVIVLPDEHRSAKTVVASLDQFADENFVVCRRYSDPGWRELVEGICHGAGFTPKVRQAVEHAHMVLALVAQGVGVSIVPASAAERVRGVRYRALPTTVPQLETAMVWRRDAGEDLVQRLAEIAEREADSLRSTRALERDVHPENRVALVTQ
jgi:DNA-binding transcriptional LysR family regulator